MQIEKLFSNNSTLYLLNREGTFHIESSPDSNSGLCLIASELSLFSFQDLAEVPNALRGDFLFQRALQLSPFKSTAHYVHITHDKAQLWVWDKELESNATDNLNVQFIPEQLLLSKPDSNLYARSDSRRCQFEYWDDGVLQRVKVYLRQTVENDRNEFLVNCPAVNQSGSWGEGPYSYLEMPRDMSAPLSKEWFVQPKILTATVLMLSIIFLSGFIGNFLGWNYLVNTKRAEVENQSVDIQPLLKQREEVLALEQSNQLITQYFQYAPVIELAAEFEQGVGAYYDELLEWNFDQGLLTVLLIDKSGNSRRYIETLSASELFEEVSASPGIRPDSVLIQMKVVSGINRSADEVVETENTSGEA